MSLSPIVLAPKWLSSAELQSIVQPTVVNRKIANYPAAEAVNLNKVLSKNDVNAKETTVEETSAHDDQSMDEISVETDEFYIETILSHQTNRDKRHPNAKVGETLYRVRWVGYGYKDDTSETLHSLTRSHVITYHEKHDIPLPEDIKVSIADTIHTPTDAGNLEGDNPTAKQPTEAHRTNDVI